MYSQARSEREKKKKELIEAKLECIKAREIFLSGGSKDNKRIAEADVNCDLFFANYKKIVDGQIINNYY